MQIPPEAYDSEMCEIVHICSKESAECCVHHTTERCPHEGLTPE